MNETSKEAYDSIDRTTLRIKVLKEILAHPFGGMTCDELEQKLGMIHQTCSARVNELMNRAIIVDSGYRRETRWGRNATVWIPNDDAKEKLHMMQEGEIT